MSKNIDPAMAVVYCRLDYAHLFKPYEGKLNQGNPKYKATLIIDPTTPRGKESWAAVQRATKHVGLEEFKKWPITWKDPKRYCVSKGETHVNDDDEIREGYEGMIIVNASNKNRPTVVDVDGRTPLVAEDMKPYSGCYAKVAIRFYTTDNGGRGLFAGLEAVQFIKDGERLGGGGSVRAEEVFEDESEEDEDEDEPVKPKKKRVTVEDDDDDEEPVKPKKKRPAVDDDEDEDEEPVPAKKKRPVVEDDEDEEPVRPKKKRPVVEDDEDEEPVRPKKKRVVVDDDDDDI